MKYNTSDPYDLENANTYFKKLVDAGKVIDLKEVRKGRTLRQNSYLHLLLAAFGLNFGYTLEESKHIFKIVNKPIFVYSKDFDGKPTTFIRSTADLDTKELTDAINKFMDYSAQAGYPLPLPTDQGWLMSIENLIEQNGGYL